MIKKLQTWYKLCDAPRFVVALLGNFGTKERRVWAKGFDIRMSLSRMLWRQVVERGYAVSEVAGWLGISTKSPHTWRAQFIKALRLRAEDSEQAPEVKGLKRELVRVLEHHMALGLGVKNEEIITFSASAKRLQSVRWTRWSNIRAQWHQYMVAGLWWLKSSCCAADNGFEFQ